MQDELTPHMALWAGACMAALGAAGIAWGLRMLRREQRLVAAGHHASGTVVGNRVETDMENSTRVHPLVEFTTAAGRTLRVECSWSTQVKYPVGTTVPVRYDPDRPEDADIVGETRLGTSLLIALASAIAAFGLLLVAVGAVGFPGSR